MFESEPEVKRFKGEMSRADEETDLTVQLPDEVLCHAFSFLSLSDKLPLEAVNQKFQRCILEELKANPQPLEVYLSCDNTLNGIDLPCTELKAKPQPLELDLCNRELNGCYIQKEDRFFDAIRNLSKKAKFRGIWVEFLYDRRGSEDKLGRILSLLISEKQCLSKVTKYNFYICSLDNGPPMSFGFPLDLSQLFKNRGLTKLKLKLVRYYQQGLVDLFQGIKPNTLRKLDLEFHHDMPGLNIAQLVKALRPNASVLEELHLRFSCDLVQLAHLFESLAGLPALRNCECGIHYTTEVQLGDQFVAAMTSLFKLSDINMTVTYDWSCNFPDLRGCQMVNMIRQIQAVHPGLVVDFGSAKEMILSLSNASFNQVFHSLID